MMKIPPFKITPLILQKSQDISRELGLITGQKLNEAPFKLRRTSNIKTIQASLAIEGNTLSFEQVTDILEGKRVIGPVKDILEVKNALSLYENLKKYNPLNIDDLLQAHAVLMSDLISESGKWRSGGVGIFKEGKVSHVAPPAKRVPVLMQELFSFLAKNKEVSWLLKACIFHYEFEFIHPFADGNGRMGRLWQQLLLIKEDPVFEFIPLEVLIRDNQLGYYQALEESDKLGDSTPFIEFSLQLIHQSLMDYQQKALPIAKDHRSRLQYAKSHLDKQWFSRQDYIAVHKDISSATASRDLARGAQEEILRKKGERNQVLYRFVEPMPH